MVKTMSEIDNILTKKEKKYWEGKPNLKTYLVLVAIFLIPSIIFFILGRRYNYYFYFIGIFFLALTIYKLLLYRYIAYAITNSRVIIQSGFIGRDYKSIDFDKIQDVGINVGLFDKIFGTGSIDIKTAGVNVVQTKYGQTVIPNPNVIAFVDNPYEVAKILKHRTHIK